MTLTNVFPSCRTGDSRQRKRVLRHEHLSKFQLPPAGARFCGPRGPAAEQMQLHTPSSPVPLQPVVKTQQGDSLTAQLWGADPGHTQYELMSALLVR